MRESNILSSIGHSIRCDSGLTDTMSTTEPENVTFKTVFLINFVVYNPVKPSAKKKKSEEKVNKLKEANLVTAPTAEGYIDFLHAVLATHGKTEYMVTLKKPYSFKYIYPVTKP
jgi:hypothetical protein